MVAARLWPSPSRGARVESSIGGLARGRHDRLRRPHRLLSSATRTTRASTRRDVFWLSLVAVLAYEASMLWGVRDNAFGVDSYYWTGAATRLGERNVCWR